MTEGPQLWVFAGPNGAGKTTLTTKRVAGRVPIVNPDEIAKTLTPGSSEPAALLKAGRIAIEQRRARLAARETFAIETTLTGKGEIAFMQAARDAGYKVNLVYIGLNRAEDSQARVATRISTGGHSVPTVDLHRRFARSMANLPAAMQIAHRSYVIDNSGEGYRLLLVRMARETRYVRRRLPVWSKAAIPKGLRQTPEMGMEM